MLGGWIFTLGKFCQRGFTQRHCYVIHTHTNTHTHREITTNLSNTSRRCKSRTAGVGFCVSSALYSAAAYGFGYNSFLRAPTRLPAASPIGILLFLFLCCSNIAFHGSLTREQSAWIFTAAVIPFFPPQPQERVTSTRRCGESVI